MVLRVIGIVFMFNVANFRMVLYFRDKRKYKFVEEDIDGTKTVKKRIPDATFGLTTYDSDALHLNHEFMAAGYQADYSNKQPDDRLSQDRLRDMMYNSMCSLVVDGAWGEASIVFPFAVYEAKKRVEDYEDARQQIQHACQIYLSMLDDLARDPYNVAKYQTKKAPPCQMFAFVSHGSQWGVYVAWSSFETCVSYYSLSLPHTWCRCLIKILVIEYRVIMARGRYNSCRCTKPYMHCGPNP